MLKKFVWPLLIVMILAMVMSGCKGEPAAESQASSGSSVSAGSGTSSEATGKTSGFNIGFANCYIGNSWRAQFVEGANETADAYKAQGLINNFQIASCNNDVTEQLNQLNAMLNGDFDAIIIDPVSPTALGPVIKEAQEKGILIVIGNDPAAYEGVYAICPSLPCYSTIETHWLASKMNGAGNIVRIIGLAGNSSCEIHTDTVNRILEEYPDINVLGTANGQWSDAEAQKAMATFLSTYQDIDGVWCEDGMSMGIVNAYEAANMPIPPLGGDYFKAFIQYWSEHPELETIVIPNSPAADAGVAIMFTIGLLQGKEVNPDVVTENPLDRSIKNYIPCDMPCVVTNPEDADLPILANYPFMEVLTVEQAMEALEGKPETQAFGLPYSQAFVDSLFLP